MLTRSRINQLSGEAQIAFCLNKQPTYEVALARAIEAEVRKQDEALIRQMLEALELYQGFINDAHIIEGQWHWLDDAKPAITAARARLENT